MLEIALIPLLASAALSTLTMWCCCVVAGDADRRMEELCRKDKEETHDD